MVNGQNMLDCLKRRCHRVSILKHCLRSINRLALDEIFLGAFGPNPLFDGQPVFLLLFRLYGRLRLLPRLTPLRLGVSIILVLSHRLGHLLLGGLDRLDDHLRGLDALFSHHPWRDLLVE